MANKKPEKPPVAGSGLGAALMAHGDDREKKLQVAAAQLQAEMEVSGAHIRDLVLAQPPTGLLGYLWSQFFMGALAHHKVRGSDHGPNSELLKAPWVLILRLHCDENGTILATQCSKVATPPILRTDSPALAAEADRRRARFTKGDKPQKSKKKR